MNLIKKKYLTAVCSGFCLALAGILLRGSAAPTGMCKAENFPDKESCSLRCAMNFTAYLSPEVSYTENCYFPKSRDLICWKILRNGSAALWRGQELRGMIRSAMARFKKDQSRFHGLWYRIATPSSSGDLPRMEICLNGIPCPVLKIDREKDIGKYEIVKILIADVPIRTGDEITLRILDAPPGLGIASIQPSGGH